MALEGVACCLRGTETARSAMLLGAAETLRGAPLPGSGADRTCIDETVALLRAALGDAAYDELVEVGRGLSAGEAIELSLRDERPMSST
jgi:hypothetical protein